MIERAIEINVQTRREAAEVLDSLGEQVDQYGQATVADLYDLVGVVGEFRDNQFGWRSIPSMDSLIRRTRSSWTLSFPPAENLRSVISTRVFSPAPLSMDDLGKPVTVKSWPLDANNIPIGEPDIYVGTLEGFWQGKDAVAIKLHGFDTLDCPNKLFRVEVTVK